MLPLAGLCALGLAAAPAVAAPPKYVVVAQQSRIGFAGVHAGNNFNGSFGQWTADIRFDPKDLAHSQANVAIATRSASTGDNFRDTTLKTAEWFDVDKQPRASFVTRRITAGANGSYIAEGVLTIKGKSVPVRLPFTLKGNGATLQMQGRTTVDRVALGLGDKSDPKGEWVSKAITITVTVVARRQG